MKRFGAATLLALPWLALPWLAGCAYPTSSIEQGSASSKLALADAAVGTQVIVDGRTIGERTKARIDSFPVTTGRHLVELTTGGRLVLRREYFVGVGSTLQIKTEN